MEYKNIKKNQTANKRNHIVIDKKVNKCYNHNGKNQMKIKNDNKNRKVII